MRLSADQLIAWQKTKARLLLPIVYVRGFALSGGEIEDTAADPFNGFNVGSTLLRTGWTGDAARHVFESPVLRLTQPPYTYRLAFSDGICGLDAETRQDLQGWSRVTTPSEGGPAPSAGPTPRAVLAIYRYYDIDSRLFGTGERAGMEAYGWGLGRLVLDLLDTTGASGVYLVAHSMGGLVARTFLQNETVLDGTNAALNGRSGAVDALIAAKRAKQISQSDWDRARGAVRRLFTYGTPHNGITGQGGLGNWLLGPVDSLLGLELANFDRERIKQYLAGPPLANSLAGKFPVGNTFCLVGTAAADYPVAGGLSRRLVGQVSDGLVEIGNAIVCGPSPGGDPNDPSDAVLAARAYVRRAHSGPYGMVNSEEGFGNLSRFLFGDARVDGDLLVQQIELPPALQAMRAEREAKGDTLEINASYSFETFLRVRGERWAMTERLARDGSAIFRRYDELFPQAGVSDRLALTAQQQQAKTWHERVELFSAFLDTSLRMLEDSADSVAGRSITGTLGFALRLRIAVPDYEVGGQPWRTNHYEGSALLDRDLAFLAFPDATVEGGWGLAWGPNVADGTNNQLQIVTTSTTAQPADPVAGIAYRRVAPPDAVEFWIPVNEPGPPACNAWLRIIARQWNSDHAPGT